MLQTSAAYGPKRSVTADGEPRDRSEPGLGQERIAAYRRNIAGFRDEPHIAAQATDRGGSELRRRRGRFLDGHIAFLREDQATIGRTRCTPDRAVGQNDRERHRPPLRQSIGKIHFGSALRLRPISIRNQTASGMARGPFGTRAGAPPRGASNCGGGKFAEGASMS